MLARRTSFVSLIYTVDNDPTIGVGQDTYWKLPGGRITMSATVAAPVTGLGSGGIVDADVDWQFFSSGAWSAATNGTKSTFNTTTGETFYTIDPIASGDFGTYRVKVTGGLIDPEEGPVILLENNNDS